MKENVLDVLIFLFENYMFEGDDACESDQETLMLELSMAGFEVATIDGAFKWLENLSELCDGQYQCKSKPGSIRYYTEDELHQFDLEARGFLLRLEQIGVLDSITRELVIERFMALGGEQVELEHLKWVTMMVLSNYTDGSGVNELTETLVLDGINTRIQ